MTHYTVGEEVLLDGERFVVSSIEGGPDGRARLLASTPSGARVVWTRRALLQKIDAYTRARDDTERSVRLP